MDTAQGGGPLPTTWVGTVESYLPPLVGVRSPVTGRLHIDAEAVHWEPAVLPAGAGVPETLQWAWDDLRDPHVRHHRIGRTALFVTTPQGPAEFAVLEGSGELHLVLEAVGRPGSYVRAGLGQPTRSGGAVASGAD